MAAAAFQHRRQRQLHAVDHAAQVDVDLQVADAVRLVEEGAHRHDAGVVDQHVDRPAGLAHRVEEAAERGRLAHVQRRGVGAEGPRRLHRQLRIDVADAHLRALGGERAGDGQADTAGAASDGDDLAGQDGAGFCGHFSFLHRKDTFPYVTYEFVCHVLYLTYLFVCQP